MSFKVIYMSAETPIQSNCLTNPLYKLQVSISIRATFSIAAVRTDPSISTDPHPPPPSYHNQAPGNEERHDLHPLSHQSQASMIEDTARVKSDTIDPRLLIIKHVDPLTPTISLFD